MLATVLVTAPIMCVGGVVMAVNQDAGLSWLLLISVPVLALANFWIVARMLPFFRRMQGLVDGLNRVLREQLSGIQVIRAFAREPSEEERFGSANRAVSKTALAAGNWQALMLPVTTLTINASSVALIWFGGRRMEDGQMQVGTLVAFLSYFMQILAAVLMATLTVMVLPRAAVCADRITAVLRTRAAVASPKEPKSPPAGIQGTLSVDAATFRYPGAERAVLDAVSFTARPGTITAIVGSTGSGKSTLTALICRLFDVSDGSIRIDGIDVRDYDLDVLWSAIGLVPQRGYLFSGTIADNLRYGKTDASEQEMWTALRIAAAEEFVRTHPDGLGMRVAQGGINLSGGQKQRIAIARAVIRRPAIYLFDDAFSALDAHTDASVRRALESVAISATTVIVSQRVSTVMHADQIVVLDGGGVVGIGSHERLLAECAAYAEFADSQSVNAIAGETP
jgi:ABC-type multidrug transport system fused ATPase/permease subunit